MSPPGRSSKNCNPASLSASAAPSWLFILATKRTRKPITPSLTGPRTRAPSPNWTLTPTTTARKTRSQEDSYGNLESATSTFTLTAVGTDGWCVDSIVYTYGVGTPVNVELCNPDGVWLDTDGSQPDQQKLVATLGFFHVFPCKQHCAPRATFSMRDPHPYMIDKATCKPSRPTVHPTAHT